MHNLILIWASVMASIAPYTPQDQLERIARVVIEATPNPEEQALLLTVSFYETTFGLRGIPFGATGRHAAIETLRRTVARGPMTEDEAARSVLNIVRRAHRQCPRSSVAARLGYFHHGRGCQSDTYSTREARTARKLLNRARVLMEASERPSCMLDRSVGLCYSIPHGAVARCSR